MRLIPPCGLLPILRHRVQTLQDATTVNHELAVYRGSSSKAELVWFFQQSLPRCNSWLLLKLFPLRTKDDESGANSHDSHHIEGPGGCFAQCVLC